MELPLVRKIFTPEEYYILEHEATFRSDFYEGEIFDMSGGSPRHSLICANLIRELGVALRGGPCKVYEANLRLMCKVTGLRTYPDAGVYCEPLDLDIADKQKTTVTNPTALFEVSSPSTKAYDDGVKRQSYWQIEKLKHYVMIAQDRPLVEFHIRGSSGGWSIEKARGLDSAVPLNHLSIALQMRDIYDGVEFDD